MWNTKDLYKISFQDASDSSDDLAGSMDLLHILECPVCTNSMKPPIYQCKNGHNLCHICASKMKTCPTCRDGTVNIRNLFAENVSLSVHHHCSNADAGCPVKLRVAQLEKHEMTCSYRPYECLIGSSEKTKECVWRGKFSDVENHVKNVHPEDYRCGPLQEYHYNSFDLTAFGEGRKLLSAYDDLFWIHRKADSKECVYFLAVQHVRSEDFGEQYKYVVKYSSADKKMKTVYERDVHSNTENWEQIYNTRCCFALHYDILQTCLVGSALKLQIEVVKAIE